MQMAVPENKTKEREKENIWWITTINNFTCICIIQYPGVLRIGMIRSDWHRVDTHFERAVQMVDAGGFITC